MIRLLWKWRCFFRPVKGWKARFLQYKAGNTVWSVPNRPDAPKVVPWPVEWMPYRQHGLTESDALRGFAFEHGVCVDTGLTAKPGDAVCCLRCGVPLHPSVAGMITSIDPPKCRRCAPIVAWIMLLGR